jgi:hypothetical protein
MDLGRQVDALERAVTRLGVRLREEELPEEAHVDGGLCRVGEQLVVYVSPSAPPWRRAEVLLAALRRLPHAQMWLPPEIRELVESHDFGESPPRLLRLNDEDER